MVTLEIDSRDLAYTIDTYGMFENNADEYILEGLQDEHPGIEYDDVDWNYNHPEYVKQLAKASINLLHNALVLHGEGVIKSIDFVRSFSPQFYNFTTDGYKATWKIDEVKLKQLVNTDELQAFLLESSWGLLDDKSDDYIVAMLDFYTQGYYTSEEYNDNMYECSNEIGHNVLEYKLNIPEVS